MRASAAGQDLDGIAAEEYLAARLTLPGADAPAGRGGQSDRFVSELVAIQQSWVERLTAEPEVRGVAIASDLPRQGHDGLRVEIEGEAALDDLDFLEGLSRWIRFARVDIDFFDALDQRVVAGRGFDRTDLTDGAATVIVNTRFVDRFLGGRNPIGRRIRFPDTVDEGQAPWYEIVGVVPRLGMNVTMPEYDSGVYFPAAPGTIYPLRFAVHVEGDPRDFSPRLRTLTAEVDPRVVVSPPMVLDRARDGNWILFLMTATSLAVLVVILVVMAASGLYAIMSFSVSERVREIGIRTALGAGRASVALGVARHSLAQIGVGALLGMPFAGWLFQLTETRLGDTGAGIGIAFGVAFATGAGLVGLIGVLSFVSPLRRALKIQPTEALRAEG